MSAEGPITKARPTTHAEGVEWLVIQFEPGVFLPTLPVSTLVDTETVLPLVTRTSFWLHGSSWQLPDYSNTETFVQRLVREEVLVRDSIVEAALRNQPQELSPRTIRRHFLRATGLTPGAVQQIERAQRAAALLEQGVTLTDVVHLAGYADQPYMTRSLKHYIGYTPAQIANMSKKST